jgi:hypothetical protein
MKKLTMKKCEDCGQTKPLDEFYYWAGGVLDYHCMKCHDTKFDNHKRKSRKKLKKMIFESLKQIKNERG